MGMPADAGPQHAELLARGAVSGARHRHVLFQLEGSGPFARQESDESQE